MQGVGKPPKLVPAINSVFKVHVFLFRHHREPLLTIPMQTQGLQYRPAVWLGGQEESSKGEGGMC